MMSRVGFIAALAAMLLFSYRLILREEADLHASQGERYQRYLQAVPRLWPALLPRLPSSGNHARWSAGFKAESWYWGCAIALVAFAITLKLKLFFAIFVASMVLFWFSSRLLQKKSKSQAAG